MTDKLTPAEIAKRAKENPSTIFADNVIQFVAKMPLDKRMELRNKLKDAETQALPRWDKLVDKASPVSGGDRSLADQLLIAVLAEKIYFFEESTETAYAEIPAKDGTRKVLAVKGRAFKMYLLNIAATKLNRSVSGNVIADVVAMLEAKANGQDMRKVSNRVAEFAGAIYIDLGDKDWQAVEVKATGWKVIPHSAMPLSVRFKRGKTLGPLPIPDKTGGTLEQLRELIRVEADGEKPTTDDSQFILVVMWLAHAFRPGVNYPILALDGTSGDGKTTLTEQLKANVDPSPIKTSAVPKTVDDLMIHAKHNHVLAFDNVSGISEDMSDAMCRLATGAGQVKRALYENDEENIIKARRPILYNGINEVSARDDIVDRSIFVTPAGFSRENSSRRRRWPRAFARCNRGLLVSC